MAEKGLPRFQVSEMFRSGVYCQNFNKGGSLIYSLRWSNTKNIIFLSLMLSDCSFTMLLCELP